MMDEKKLNSTIEHVFRFGQIAIRRGFITEQQLEDVLDEQKYYDLANDNHKLIGEILHEEGWMTKNQIENVLDNSSKIKICSSGYLKYNSK